MSTYVDLAVSPVVNASGIYTDFGGSVLSPTVRQAVDEANSSWASMTELLPAAGRVIADLLGVEAAHVVPGVAASLALCVGACMTGANGEWMEQLPDTAAIPRANVVMQRAHRYKYARCALVSGARLREVGDDSTTTKAELRAALGPDVACVLHPVHLDGTNGGIPLAEVVELAHEAGVPVVVDAAYLSYPTELIASFATTGADLVCFSAKYFFGPNAGGFVYGRADLVDALAAIDFTRFESGDHLLFGRVFKMDRSTVVATTVALREWLAMDHEARWAAYGRRAERMIADLAVLPAKVQAGHFTLDERVLTEPVNAVVIRPDGEIAPSAASLDSRLAEGNPSIRGIVVDDVLVIVLETVLESEDVLVVERLLEAFGTVAR